MGRALIFDFDGVIADSEVHANRALVECLTSVGFQVNIEDCIRDYYGTNWQETERRIERNFQKKLPENFRSRYLAYEHALLGEGASPVAGIGELLTYLDGKILAIASSSSEAVIRTSLKRFGIDYHFGEHIFSADGWSRGKPSPDIYLAAAEGIGVPPDDCTAIEDSPNGAQAALSAGMTVIGFCGASHIEDKKKHAETLRAIGVHEIALSHADVRDIVVGA